MKPLAPLLLLVILAAIVPGYFAVFKKVKCHSPASIFPNPFGQICECKVEGMGATETKTIVCRNDFWTCTCPSSPPQYWDGNKCVESSTCKK